METSQVDVTKMETSQVDVEPDAFKVPQPLKNEKHLDIKTDVLDNESTAASEKSNKSDSDKATSKSVKNRVDVPLPYNEPSWGGIPPPIYSFEIIKNGTFIETYHIRSSYVVFGRLDVCNIIFEHPSVSRYHAILQYCQGDSKHDKGFYLYDLGSTHGTFLNKEKVTPKIYYKLKVGYVIKFGGSSRLHIFQGPEEEEVEKESTTPKIEQDMCTWGMAEDAEEEEDLSENPFALSIPNEELYLEDPKKTLRNWFEREGYELEYDVEEKGFRTFVCRVQLPIDTPTGDYMPVEASVTGKKKEAVIACALEACRTLDRLGLLRQSNQESRQKKKKKWEENDYYDSDEDTFLDRTGTIEKKREMRKRIEKKKEAETFESIEAKLKVVTDEICEIEKKLSVNKSDVKSENDSEVDTLEAYMSNLSDSKGMASDKIERRKLRYNLQEAEKEKTHLEKLLDIARPTKLPSVSKYPGMIGKRLKTKLQIPTSKKEEIVIPSSKFNENGEEEDEDSDSENMAAKSSKDIDKSVDESSVKNSEEKVVKTYGLIFNINNPDEELNPITKERSNEKLEISESVECSKKRVVGCEKPKDTKPPRKKKKNEKMEQNVDVYTAGNSDYSTWVPPTGQSGDGMTHLNAKYGY